MTRASALAQCSTPIRKFSMTTELEISPKDLKHYPHFDAPISIREIKRLVNDPGRVATNAFYPFLLYHEKWRLYRSANAVRPEEKSRPIRYGARRDASIFTHYRRKLAGYYEERLRNLGISQCPIAYRKIRKSNGTGGKCNIDFAKDAFDQIDRLGNCVAIALDIKSYFENLEHSLIKQIWCDLLGVDELPPDHYAVFKNITKYRFVDQMEVFRRLNYLGTIERAGKTIEEFKVTYRDMPKQLCSPEDFRAKICGGNPAYPSLIKKNTEPYGVPQGAPISDLIANFYLMEFDCSMHQYAMQYDGLYMRYSDDILVVLPGDEADANAAVCFSTDKIREHGDQLQINEEKTCVIKFQQRNNQLTYQHIKQRQNEPAKNGLEYLGFRYDGRKVYIRDSTISKFYRKISAAAKVKGARHVMENPKLDTVQLLNTFDFSLFSQRFSRVKRGDLTNDYRSWTFYSYLKRSAATFRSKGDRILRQSRNFKKVMRSRIKQTIVRAVDHKCRKGAKVAPATTK